MRHHQLYKLPVLVLAFLVGTAAHADRGITSGHQQGALAEATPAIGALSTEAAVGSSKYIYSALQPELLIDQNGKQLSVDKLLGKNLLVNFMFTSCQMVCPMQTRSLVRVRDNLPRRVRKGLRQLSVTINPDYDTPDVLKAYAKTHDADVRGWSFATGDAEDIKSITENFDKFDTLDTHNHRGSGAHKTELWLVTADGRLVKRFAGSPINHGELIAALTELHNTGWVK